MLNKEINNALTRNTDSLRQVSSHRGAVVAGEASPEEIAEALMDIGRVLIDNNVKLANLLAHYGMRGLHDCKPTDEKNKSTLSINSMLALHPYTSKEAGARR